MDLFWHHLDTSVCGTLRRLARPYGSVVSSVSFRAFFPQVWVSFDTVHIPQYAARCSFAHRYMEVWSYWSVISLFSFRAFFTYVWVSFDTVHIPQYAARCNFAHRYMAVWSYGSVISSVLFLSFLFVCVGLFWHCSHTSVCGAQQLRAQLYGSIMP